MHWCGLSLLEEFCLYVIVCDGVVAEGEGDIGCDLLLLEGVEEREGVGEQDRGGVEDGESEGEGFVGGEVAEDGLLGDCKGEAEEECRENILH